MSSLFRSLWALPLVALAAFTVGCANENGGPTGSVTAGFTDGSTYAVDGPFVVTTEGDHARVAGRLIEPTTGDELDLVLTLPEGNAQHREADVDAELTLVRANAKKTARVHVVIDDNHLVLKGESGSPVLAGTIDLR
jgi:hypothetical protein